MAKGFILIEICLCMSLLSCRESQPKNMYVVEAGSSGTICLPLMDWNVCGAFSHDFDSINADSFALNPFAYRFLQNPDTTIRYWHNGLYHPLYNQLDLKEVFHITPNDTTHTLKEKIVYLYCILHSKKEADVYVEVKKSMKCIQRVNGDTLHRKEVQGLNIYPVHLKKGNNLYSIKAIVRGEDYSLEATVHDSLSIARLYLEGQSCNIVYPQIFPDSNIVQLTNPHQRVLDTPVILQFFNVKGMKMHEITLESEKFVYSIPKVERNISYMCTMTICGATVRQPVLCGEVEETYKRFVDLRSNLSENHPKIPEIDKLLYRLQFLLKHPSRNDGDWWWQFKISPVTYQLEHLFANLDKPIVCDDTEANIKFATYLSEIDCIPQSYLLARPNHIDNNSPLPLVVVIRPNIEKYHPFLSSPQIARQWALNQMQALANRHHYIIMMPEMRTYLDEDVTPEIASELQLAIKDVCKRYKIDKNRMYLHANCSGGYRALRIATENPDLFAAIGLYAPIYQRSGITPIGQTIDLKIRNLKNIPIFIHDDPIDQHGSHEQVANLIKECKKEGVSYTLSIKRNSGKFYNVCLVGEEALDFYKDKNNIHH